MTHGHPPQHCPFCADTDLWPQVGEGLPPGAWACRSCTRTFVVEVVGLARPAADGEAVPHVDA